MKPPEFYVVDTNVPVAANRKHPFDGTNVENETWILACVEAIERVCTKNALVLDEEDEIFEEYLRHLSPSGQPGVGDKFVKWVKDNRGQLPTSRITKNGDSYNEFPLHEGLKNFDKEDRKFVAVSNAYPPKTCSKKPAIMQATDSKWFGWKDALKEVGIDVIFLCPEYVERKYKVKFPQNRK